MSVIKANNGYEVGTVEEVVYRLGNIANREDINQLRIEMVRDLKAIITMAEASAFDEAADLVCGYTFVGSDKLRKLAKEIRATLFNQGYP